ncbi:MAG: ABC transporter ATP-binding protein [Bacilli bacterium]|nr:ABC transporter ATP-binding protein [Bacilli bacterium]
MKKILNHLKKHIVTIILIIVFLFIQAMCDLALPDYTSKIVDIGIRQNGIEDNVFNEIKKEDFNKILLFLTNEDKKFVESKYELKDDLYFIKNVSEFDRNKLSDILIEPEIYIVMLNDETIKKMGFNSEKQFYKSLSKMNDEQLKQQRLSMKFDNIDDSFKIQFGIKYVNDIYQKASVNISDIQNSYIKSSGLKMLAIALIAAIVAIIISFLSSKLAAKFSKDLRKSVVTKVMEYSNRELKEIGVVSLITRSTNDISRIQMFTTMVLRILIYAPIIGIGALLKVVNNSMSFIIAIAVGLILLLVVILFTLAMPKFKIVQDLIDRINLIFREILNGMPVIRSFSNEKHEEERFDEANKNLTKVNLFVNRVMTIMMPTMTFIMNLICLLIIWVGSNKIDAGTIQIGTLMAFIQYTIQIIMSFLMISMMSIMIPRAWVSMKRIGEILNKEPSIKDPEIITDIGKKFKGKVEFRDVYFRYHDADEDILENISFVANPGTTTAIIGGTGSGKSTLINLIPRFFDVTGGKILIDGVDIKNLSLYDLRENIGLIPQQGLLFTGTIESNIAFSGDEIDNENIQKSAKISQSLEFINEKKDKFKTEISQGGTNVSGGQKQRLSIARAIYKNPSIYIFDDSFSALDFKTDKKLRNELKKVSKDKTVFIVAQRISTVLSADQIIVLDEGKIVGIGKHEELMAKCEVYKEIALSQVTEEELKHGK